MAGTKYFLDLSDTSLETWFERDRAHVALMNKLNDKVIVEWWDDEVAQAIEDGFLDHRAFAFGRLIFEDRLHRAAFDYAKSVGRLSGKALNFKEYRR